MTTRKYSSRSQQTTLTGALSSSATTASVVSGSSLLGGVTVSPGQTYTVVIDPDTALEEIVDITAVSGNTLTITRGIDGSTGQEHAAGAVVRHMAIGRDFREANTHIENTTTAHGITLADLVKTTDSGTVTSTMIADGTIVNADINSSAAIADTKLGTISTAGKVSNSATTATSSNTASAIVARDASGNFSAGTVTASLTGNVTGNVSGSSGSTTGNAATATKLATARDIQLVGDVEASAQSFDGSGNVTLTTVIATGTIVNADINSSAAIDKTKISGTAITAGDTGTVTSTMIANDTIVNADISSTAAISKSKLDLSGTITSADIVDGTIVNSDINASAGIALSKLATDPLARANHTGTQVASTISDFDTQVRTSKVTDLAAPTGSFSMNSQKITSLGTPTSTTDAATKDYVDTQVSALVNGAPSTLDTLKEIADAISSGGTFYDAVVLKGGSTMTGALVLNADPSVSLGAATKQYVDAVAGSATSAAASAAAAAASYDSFDDRYLGAKSSAPTLDNDGNALVTGALYWNTGANAMYVWDGSTWAGISSTAAIFRFKFLPSGGATSVSGADANGVTLAYLAGKEQVYLNGVLLVRDTDYTASDGSSITSIAAMASGDVLEVITFTAFDLATAIDKTLLDAKGDLIVASAADTPGKLAAGTNGYFLQADSTQALGLKWAAVDLSSYATTSSVTTLSNTHDADTMMFIMGAY